MNWTYTLGTEDGKEYLVASDAILTMPFPEQVEDYEREFGSRLMWIAVSADNNQSIRRVWDRPADMDERISISHQRRIDQLRIERLKTELHGAQKRCAVWRENKPEPTDDGQRGWLPPTQTNIIAKMVEEVGEWSTAIIGILENREDRGDDMQEAAQCILVLLSWCGIHHPDRCLLSEVLNEMERLGA